MKSMDKYPNDRMLDRGFRHDQNMESRINIPVGRTVLSNGFGRGPGKNVQNIPYQGGETCMMVPGGVGNSQTICDVGFKPCPPMIPASFKQNRIELQPKQNQIQATNVQPYNQYYLDRGMKVNNNASVRGSDTSYNQVGWNERSPRLQNQNNLVSISNLTNNVVQQGFSPSPNGSVNVVNTGYVCDDYQQDLKLEAEIDEVLSEHPSYVSQVEVPRFHKCIGTATNSIKKVESTQETIKELISLKQVNRDLKYNRDWRSKIDPDELSNKLNLYISQQANAKKGDEFGDVISKVNALALQIENSTKTFVGKKRGGSSSSPRQLGDLVAKSTKLVLKENIEPIVKVMDRDSDEFLIRPFASKNGNDPNIVDVVVPDAKKDWHLQAIKQLSKEEFSLLKLKMLQLVNGRSNIDPDKLCFYASLVGDEEPRSVSYKILQQGTFGIVYQALIGSSVCAVKTPSPKMLIKDPFGILRRIVSEWSILSKCRHNHIVKLVGGVVLGAYDVWLATELVDGMDLQSLKQSNLSKSLSVRGLEMCRQLAEAVCYLHTPINGKGKIIHRDIKPENIVVDKNFNITLCDFGDSIELVDGAEINLTGATWLYSPPELLVLDPLNNASMKYENVVTEKWDIWSMGCVFMEMLGFPNPFYRIVKGKDTYKALVEHASSGMVPWIPNSLSSTIVGDVIRRALSLDPSARPSAEELLQLLS